jgi:MFS family permease
MFSERTLNKRSIMSEHHSTLTLSTDQQTNTSKRSTLRRNLSFCFSEGIVAMPIVYLALPGNFIIALLLTQVFQLSDSTFGLIVSLPAWCNVAQLIIIPFLGKIWSQKTITLIFSWLHLFVWSAMGAALPFIPQDNIKTAGQVLFLFFLFSSLLQAMVGVSWTSWIQEWIPSRIRGKFFGKRNRTLQVSTILFILGTTFCLNIFEESNAILGFQIIIYGSVFLRIISIVYQQKILSTSDQNSGEIVHNIKAQIRFILQSKPLKLFFLFGALFGFSTSFLGPFFTVFLYEVMGLGVDDLAIYTIVASIAGAVSLPAWGRLLDIYGNRPVILVILFLWMFLGYSWCFVTPERTWILYFAFASGGLFSAGFILGTFNLLLKLIPKEAKTTAISLQVAITSATAAIAPIIGGFLLEQASTSGVDKLKTFQAMGFVHHTLILLSGLILFKIAEQKSAPLNQVIGAMRSFRQIGALTGLTFFANYTFTRRKRRKR